MNITKEMIGAFAKSFYGIKGPQMVIEIGPEIEAALKAAFKAAQNVDINDEFENWYGITYPSESKQRAYSAFFAGFRSGRGALS